MGLFTGCCLFLSLNKKNFENCYKIIGKCLVQYTNCCIFIFKSNWSQSFCKVKIIFDYSGSKPQEKRREHFLEDIVHSVSVLCRLD
jgi:hypothetical protein